MRTHEVARAMGQGLGYCLVAGALVGLASATLLALLVLGGRGASAGTERLTLLTCYPFDALRPGGPLRYVVIARRATDGSRT